MFSSKNYGLPKELIEAAKKVHEKQLREPKNEEVQFTEEELAEAFATFLEENFHVEMLTEEDLDYVFENEFPQWLEEETFDEKMARLKRERELAAIARAKERDRQDADDGALLRQREAALAAAREREAANKGAKTKPSSTVSANPGTVTTADILNKRAELSKRAELRKRAGTGGNQLSNILRTIVSPETERQGAETPGTDANPGTVTTADILSKRAELRKRAGTGAKPASTARRTPKIDYKTPISTRDPVTGTYQLTDKGRKYVAKTDKNEFGYRTVFGND